MRLSATLLLLALLACRSAAPEDGPAPPSDAAGAGADPAPVRPWTTTFLPAASLVAASVRIEGPDDLLDHVAILQDDENMLVETRTTEEGLLQTLRPRPDRGLVELRAQLDNLTIVAFRELVVLRRPGDVPVRVRARGEVWWGRDDGTAERREDTLELVGE